MHSNDEADPCDPGVIQSPSCSTSGSYLTGSSHAAEAHRQRVGDFHDRPIQQTERMDKNERVSATCPIWHEGQLRAIDAPPEWYVLPAATLGLPDDEEKRVGRGVPVGISVCPRCD
jgi:hypothetical protein